MPSISKQSPAPQPRPAQQRGRDGPGTAARASVLDRIAPIGFDDDDGIRCLFYGRSATGKTSTWATFPKPILAVIVSGSSKPGELRTIDTPEYRKTVSQVVLESSAELFELSAHARSTGRYKTVVLDHASGLQDLVLKELLGVDQLPAQKGWGLASQQTWGQCTQQCKELLRDLLGLNCNVVVVAQERIHQAREDGVMSDVIQPFVGAGLTPSLAGWLAPAADLVCQTFIRQKERVLTTTIGEGKNAQKMESVEKVPGEVEYCLRTAPSAEVITKFRVPRGKKLPPVIVDPTYEKIMALVRGDPN